MSAALRIIDANANRAREALRVMEEVARFALDDAELTRATKSLRHDLSRAMSRLDGLEFNRDTPGDIGTSIKEEGERTRASMAEVVIAAGRRLSEALRAIEEYGKTIDPGFAASIEKLRYRGYALEQRLNLAMGSDLARQWRVCVIITQSLCRGGGWERVSHEAIEAGADCLQLREKELDGGELLRRARALVELASLRASIIINDRPDIALLAGADGVHLGQDDLPCAEVRKLVGRQLIVGVSTSRLTEAQRALRDGADYCGAGPMFPSATKAKDRIAGTDYLREYLAWDRLPHLAIGGITPGNIGELIQSGVRGIAVSSCVCGADRPGDVVAELRAAIDDARTR